MRLWTGQKEPTNTHLQQWLFEKNSHDVNMVVGDGLVKGSDEVGVGGVDVDEGRGEKGRDNILVSTTAGVAQSCVPVLAVEEVRGERCC